MHPSAIASGQGGVAPGSSPAQDCCDRGTPGSISRREDGRFRSARSLYASAGFVQWPVSGLNAKPYSTTMTLTLGRPADDFARERSWA